LRISSIFRFHSIDDVQCVEPEAHHDDTRNGFALSVPFRDALAKIGSKGNNTQVSNENRRAVIGRY